MENVDKIPDNEDREKYTNLTRTIIDRVLKKDKEVTFFDIVTIAMGVVERVKGERKLSGQEKKDLAKTLLSLVVDILVQVGKIEASQSKDLKKDLLTKTVLTEQFIDMAALLTNDPELVNSGKWILKESQEIIKFCCKDKCILL